MPDEQVAPHERLRRPSRTIRWSAAPRRWFAGWNFVWGAVLGLVISIVWLVSMQTAWFALVICLAGTILSAIYGLVASTVAHAFNDSAEGVRIVNAGVGFAVTAMILQLGLIAANDAWPLVWNAAAYSVLGAGVAVLLPRRVPADAPVQPD